MKKKFSATGLSTQCRRKQPTGDLRAATRKQAIARKLVAFLRGTVIIVVLASKVSFERLILKSHNRF
jgi:hypothetical protein